MSLESSALFHQRIWGSTSSVEGADWSDDGRVAVLTIEGLHVLTPDFASIQAWDKRWLKISFEKMALPAIRRVLDSEHSGASEAGLLNYLAADNDLLSRESGQDHLTLSSVTWAPSFAGREPVLMVLSSDGSAVLIAMTSARYSTTSTAPFPPDDDLDRGGASQKRARVRLASLGFQSGSAQNTAAAAVGGHRLPGLNHTEGAFYEMHRMRIALDVSRVFEYWLLDRYPDNESSAAFTFRPVPLRLSGPFHTFTVPKQRLFSVKWLRPSAFAKRGSIPISVVGTSPSRVSWMLAASANLVTLWKLHTFSDNKIKSSSESDDVEVESEADFTPVENTVGCRYEMSIEASLEYTGAGREGGGGGGEDRIRSIVWLGGDVDADPHAGARDIIPNIKGGSSKMQGKNSSTAKDDATDWSSSFAIGTSNGRVIIARASASLQSEARATATDSAANGKYVCVLEFVQAPSPPPSSSLGSAVERGIGGGTLSASVFPAGVSITALHYLQNGYLAAIAGPHRALLDVNDKLHEIVSKHPNAEPHSRNITGAASQSDLLLTCGFDGSLSAVYTENTERANTSAQSAFIHPSYDTEKKNTAKGKGKGKEGKSKDTDRDVNMDTDADQQDLQFACISEPPQLNDRHQLCLAIDPCGLMYATMRHATIHGTDNTNANAKKQQYMELLFSPISFRLSAGWAQDVPSVRKVMRWVMTGHSQVSLAGLALAYLGALADTLSCDGGKIIDRATERESGNVNARMDALARICLDAAAAEAASLLGELSADKAVKNVLPTKVPANSTTGWKVLTDGALPRRNGGSASLTTKLNRLRQAVHCSLLALSKRAHRSSLYAAVLSAEVEAVLSGICQELQLSAGLEVLLACPTDRPLSVRESFCVSSLEARHPSLRNSRKLSKNAAKEQSDQPRIRALCSLCGCHLSATSLAVTGNDRVACSSCRVTIPRCARSGRLCTTTTTLLSIRPESITIARPVSDSVASKEDEMVDENSNKDAAPINLHHELLQCSLCSSVVIADSGLRDGELNWTGWYSVSPLCMFCALPLEVVL